MVPSSLKTYKLLPLVQQQNAEGRGEKEFVTLKTTPQRKVA